MADLMTLEDKTKDLAALAYAANTTRAYRSDLAHFSAWCAERECDPIPAAPATLAAYIADCQGKYSTATIQRCFSAIRKAHLLLGFPSPLGSPQVMAVWRGLRRLQGTAPKRAKRPLLLEHVKRMIASIQLSPTCIRDTAIILLGFAGAFRRSELCGLDLEDLTFEERGVKIRLRRSKTDQTGEGRVIGIPPGASPATCPVQALQAWLRVRGDAPGPLFPSTRSATGVLTPQMVRLIVRRACQAAGIDPSDYSAHSLRSGFVTQAIRGGASDHSVMDQTGHRDASMIRRYRKESELFRDNPAGRLGL